MIGRKSKKGIIKEKVDSIEKKNNYDKKEIKSMVGINLLKKQCTD